jgi:hypothetical protein
MCTGFVKKGQDLICGFNMDLPDGLWNYRVYTRKDQFFVGVGPAFAPIRIHGVGSGARFGNLPYMNAPERGRFRPGFGRCRIDSLVHRYIGGKLDFDRLEHLARTKEIVNLPGHSMHSLFCDAEGRILLVEPGDGARRIEENEAVISNFPLMVPPEDLTPERHGFYGVDRYDRAMSMLRSAGDDFSMADGIEVLRAVAQKEYAPTRVSFVYSRRENAVLYALEGQFDQLHRWEFA